MSDNIEVKIVTKYQASLKLDNEWQIVGYFSNKKEATDAAKTALKLKTDQKLQKIKNENPIF